MSAAYTVRQVGDVTIVDVVGRITLGEGSDGLRDKIGELVVQDKKKVILNLAETWYIDSSGIGELVSGFTRLSNCGATLKLLVLCQQPKHMFKITKLNETFEVFEDEAEAVASFR